ncbi:DUF572-domain-containing protein [Aureobasidium subglaciale]|nr:DUF572-domain-containing protein [Aureobasidium subglaciale]
MAERKVISKYYPPDFDPSKLRQKRSPNNPGTLPTVTVMSPFSMRCSSCSTYIYKGRKFNARKEKAEETYLTIPIHRLYIRCTGCSSEICFKTDPKSTGYVCEKGATRNSEPWKEEEKGGGQNEANVMTVVEEKVMDAKTDMAVADALDEIRTRNARREMAANRLSSLAANHDIHDELDIPMEDNRAAVEAFGPCNERIYRLPEDMPDTEDNENTVSSDSVLTFRRFKRQKKDRSAALGIKKKCLGSLVTDAQGKQALLR